ncbi:MAG TPA: HAMP domain-containing sensor histidine kinase [Ilumatobacter sp.]|nr:HAMP domain-containing sensor histidine kinase [Ilumatobacter sp.]
MSQWRLNRLGRRFMWGSLGVLGVAVVMILISAQQMFISDQDLGVLMWIMLPAAVVAALTAYMLSTPIARDARRLSEAALAVGDGDLTARTGVTRADELGDAASAFDLMVGRLDSMEKERALMLSSISHDLRTPLAALRASVEAIRDGVAEDPDAYLRGMEHQVTALGHLVDDLSLHTRLASGTLDMRRTRVDLTEVADEAIETMRPLAADNQVTLAMTARERVSVDGDAAQLSRVVRNLLDNAIRHAPSGGHVELSVSAEGSTASLEVSDNGPGFPPGLKAFEPFTRGDPARDVRTGTAGLGLAIARGIVAAHAGTVDIVPRPDGQQGGCVSVELPIT